VETSFEQDSGIRVGKNFAYEHVTAAGTRNNLRWLGESRPAGCNRVRSQNSPAFYDSPHWTRIAVYHAAYVTSINGEVRAGEGAPDAARHCQHQKR